MAMKLIRKKAPRGALRRWLSEEEDTAVRNVFGRKQVRSAQERALAEHVILEMRKNELWLQCSGQPARQKYIFLVFRAYLTITLWQVQCHHGTPGEMA